MLTHLSPTEMRKPTSRPFSHTPFIFSSPLTITPWQPQSEVNMTKSLKNGRKRYEEHHAPTSHNKLFGFKFSIHWIFSLVPNNSQSLQINFRILSIPQRFSQKLFSEKVFRDMKCVRCLRGGEKMINHLPVSQPINKLPLVCLTSRPGRDRDHHFLIN